ncbi:MAG: hypothetical protein NC430_07275 [bacterium]|nr:hypothetical protein [bacterium]MCM1423619.1 hypothetical protein [bacterium]
MRPGERWQVLDVKLNEMFRMLNGRQVILWGYGQSGCFLEHIFARKNRKIDYIVDNFKRYPSRLHIYTPSFIQELDCRNCFVICTFPEDDESRSFLAECGFEEYVSYINLNKYLFGNDSRKLSYYDWLEHYYGADIVTGEGVGNGDNRFYSYGNDYALMDVLDDFSFTEEDSVFDFGCGKGGPMIMFFDKGVGHVGGVEFDKHLCDIAGDNLEKCGVTDYKLWNDNALNIREELDRYNIFFMYNPFVGNTFRGVIKNMEDSYLRNRRKMFLIYSGVTQHKDVVNNGYFRFAKRIENDYWNKYSNIYVIDELD